MEGKFEMKFVLFFSNLIITAEAGKEYCEVANIHFPGCDVAARQQRQRIHKQH